MSRRPENRSPENFKNYIKFMIAAIVLMVLMDQFIFPGERPYIKKMKEDYRAEQARKATLIDGLLPPPVEFDDVEPMAGVLFPPKSLNTEFLRKEKSVGKTKVDKKARGAKIAIVIDDMGVNRKQSFRAINLPVPVTLAFLPYASGVRDMAAKAKAKKHELIIHAPMEAISSSVPLGGMALKVGMNGLDFSKEFHRMMGAFEGYVGVNNHMGSKLTQDKRSMALLMEHLKQRDLYFLDSKTIHSSIAAETAAQAGLRYAERDVFLDHEETPEFLADALKRVERIALRRGSAIAIGHPKAVTINALNEWIPKAKKSGYEFVFVSSLLEE